MKDAQSKELTENINKSTKLAPLLHGGVQGWVLIVKDDRNYSI